VTEEPAAPGEPAETPKADDSVGVAQPENENANEESNT